MKFLGKAKTILGFLTDCLFPKCCIVCNGKVNVKEYSNLCSLCISKIPWIKGGRCSLCSRPMTNDMSDEALICSECKGDTSCLKGGISCWLHRGIGRDIVLTLKYRNADFIKNDIANLLKIHCHEACKFAESSVLVPVPTHYIQRVKRGYNQAEVIAHAVAKATNDATVADILKSKHKKSQTQLKRGERLINVKGTFECSAKANAVPRDSKIVLVDDVSTTGATVRECCRILNNEGFDNVHALTLSYG